MKYISFIMIPDTWIIATKNIYEGSNMWNKYSKLITPKINLSEDKKVENHQLKNINTSVVVYTFNHIPQETEAGGLQWVWGQPGST